MRSKKGGLESPAKAKSRLKKFEADLQCGHRLSLSYASNSPGDLADKIKNSSLPEDIKNKLMPPPDIASDLIGKGYLQSDEKGTLYPVQGGPPKIERKQNK